MDPSVQHSFRSAMIGDINRAINNLIEGESAMKRAVGRLWQAIYSMKKEEDTGGPAGPSEPQKTYPSPPHANGDIPGEGRPPRVQENGDIMDPVDDAMQDIFDPLENDDFNSEEVPKVPSLPAFASPGLVSHINELAGDSAEYVARLEEVREGLGFTLGQRDALWMTLREKALVEMQQQEEELEEE